MKGENALFWLKKGILVNFCLFLILVPYFRNISKTFLVIGGILWLFLAILDGKKYFYRVLFCRNYLNKPILIFIFASLLAVVFSQDPYHSQKVFFSRHFFYLMFFLIGSGLAVDFKFREFKENSLPQNTVFLVALIVLSGVILGIGGVRDFLIFQPGRLFAVFGKEVPFSMLPVFLVFFTSFSLSFALFSKGWPKAAGILSSILLVPCWAWSGSRAAWVAVALSVFIVIILFSKGKKKLIFLIIFIAFIGSVFSFVAHESAQNRLDNLFKIESYSGRPELIIAAYDIFKDYPLFGSGLGTYGKIAPKHPLGPKHLHAHNTYIEILAESGIVGFLTFLFVFSLFFKKLFKAVKGSLMSQQAVFIGLWGLFTAVLIFELFSSSILVGMQFAPLFWFLLGVTSAVNNFDKQKNKVT